MDNKTDNKQCIIALINSITSEELLKRVYRLAEYCAVYTEQGKEES